MDNSGGDRIRKDQCLRKDGTLNPSADKVSDPLFLEHEFFDPRDVVQVRYEMLRRAHDDGQSVTAVAEAFGVSRPTYYEARRAFDESGLQGLVPRKRGPKGAHKLTDEVMDFVMVQFAQQEDIAAHDLAHRIQERFGLQIHTRSIERAVARRKKGVS